MLTLISSLFDCTNKDFKNILHLLKIILQMIQILVPIGLILMGSIDFGKAALSANEDNIKKGQKSFARRCIAAVLVFLVVTIVSFVMNFIGNSAWKDCWNRISSAIPTAQDKVA